MWLQYDDKYDVSSDGEVRNRKSGRILKSSDVGDGYQGVVLCHKGIMYSKRVAKIVADRFCPKINLDGLTVDHIDRDTTNDNASNLRWVDRSTQQINRNMPLSSSGNRHIYLLKSGKVMFRICRYNMKIVQTYDTLEEAITARNKIIYSL